MNCVKYHILIVLLIALQAIIKGQSFDEEQAKQYFKDLYGVNVNHKDVNGLKQGLWYEYEKVYAGFSELYEWRYKILAVGFYFDSKKCGKWIYYSMFQGDEYYYSDGSVLNINKMNKIPTFYSSDSLYIFSEIVLYDKSDTLFVECFDKKKCILINKCSPIFIFEYSEFNVEFVQLEVLRNTYRKLNEYKWLNFLPLQVPK